MTGVNHFSPIPLANPNINDGADRGIVNGTVPESERIEIQPGDVVGFYLESSRGPGTHDGIQYAGDGSGNDPPPHPDYTSESVWYTTGTDVSRDGFTECLLPTSPGFSSTGLAPLITVTICKSDLVSIY